MRASPLFALVLLLPSFATAQHWSAHRVTFDFDGAWSVFAADIDGDSDMDVIGAANRAEKIAWWENEDGTGLSWIEHPIDEDFDYAEGLFVADVDGDGDMDVIGAAAQGDLIQWWENYEGTGLVWIEHTVDTQFDGALSVYATDLDGDGDIDILGAAFHANTISWWENLTGSGTVWSQHEVDDSFRGVTCVCAGDVDGDGDLDVLGSASDANEIAWWGNEDGTGTSWFKHRIVSRFMHARSVHSADINSDGYLDVIGAARDANDIVWWQNVRGDGLRWKANKLDNNFVDAINVYAADVDNDGDVDILGAAAESHKIAWWENRSFTCPYWGEMTLDNTFEGAVSVYAADVDGDGDTDILGAATYIDQITWWENPLITTQESVAYEQTERLPLLVGNSPNPFNAMTTVTVALPEVSDLTVRIVNITGQQVAELAHGSYQSGVHEFAFDATGLASGIYFVHATVPGQLDAVQKVMLVR